MRISADHIGSQLRELAGGAMDAARGQRADKAARDAQPEAAFEPLDKLLLKRLALQTTEEAASSATSFAEAQALVERTRALMGDSPEAARTAQSALLRERVRDLFDQ